MAKWDIAREPFDCFKCADTVGQGEAFRISKVPGRGFCEDCSVRIDGETCPEHVRPRSVLERLNDELAQAAPKGSSFARFEDFNPAELPASIQRELASKASAASVRAGRQPAFDPRGQNRNRHGVAAAMRAYANVPARQRRHPRKPPTAPIDFSRRAAGERDE
jgi:hypothetical protein